MQEPREPTTRESQETTMTERRPETTTPERRDRTTLDRRTLLGAAATASTAALAGCTDWLLESDSRTPPLVEDRPDAVYYPTHVEGMAMAGATDVGPYRAAVSYSFPHRFWLVTGERAEQVTIEESDTVHLMASVWDRETGQVVPSGSVSLELRRDGETAVSGPLWTMLSQNMGLHFGDNVTLPGEGTYSAEVSVGPVGARRTGAFEGRFGEAASAELEIEFSRSTLDDVMYRRLPGQQGDPGAVDPMEMEMLPLSRTPTGEELPGELLGEATSGDAVVLAVELPDPPAGVQGAGPYLAVSPRTPYNRYPLVGMGLSGRLERGSETVFEGTLAPTFDPELGYHYGATVPGVEAGDSVTVTVDAPPQIARHEGYETAFRSMSPVVIRV
jgi:uncharacterized protein involved in high-affinity Fe2+ transport